MTLNTVRKSMIDPEFVQEVQDTSNKIGNLSELKTTNKTDIVKSVNEVSSQLADTTQSSYVKINASSERVVKNGTFTQSHDINYQSDDNFGYYSNQVGDYVELSFDGTGISVHVLASDNKGKVEVFIDNVSQGVYDCYSATEVYSKKIFEIDGLSNTQHTIKVALVSAYNPSATARYFNIESFVVKNYSLEALKQDVKKDAAKQTAKHAAFFMTTNFKNTLKIQNYTPDTFYAMLDAINHPYLTYGGQGKDSSNSYTVRLYKYEPTGYEKTIFITGGVHGDEPFTTYFVVELLKILTSSKDIPPQLRYIKEKVRILAIPIVNPWGMYQSPKTRHNSNGVDINRNWNWNWANQPDVPVFTHGHKGTAPISEEETKIVDRIFALYKDICGYLDVHNFVNPNNTDYLVYGDTKTEKEMRILLDFLTKDDKSLTTLHYTTANDASGNNYASQVVGIPSVNVEAIPDGANSLFSNDFIVNKYFTILFNTVIALASYKKVDRGNFSVANFVRSYADSELVLANNVKTDITHSSMTTTPVDDGFLTVNGFIMAKNTTNTADVFTANLFVEQAGVLEQIQTVYIAPYTNGTYPVIPLNATIPVIKGKPTTLKIVATNEGTGACHIKRFNLDILYVSAYNSRRFSRMDVHNSVYSY